MEGIYRKKVNIKSGDLDFQALEWLEYNEKEETGDEDDMEIDEEENSYYNNVEDKEMYKYLIRIFGVNGDGNSVCLNIKNFRPFFYVKVPDNWDKTDVKLALIRLKKALKTTKIKEGDVWKTLDFSNCLLESACILEKKYDFYGFNNKTLFTFMKLTFSNSDAMKKCITIIKKNNSGLKNVQGLDNLPLYESNIDSFIKFAHTKNLKFCGWINASNPEYSEPEFSKSNCQIEATVDWNNVNYLDNAGNAPILQASYDIETYSHDGSFPSPNVKQNVITQIATSFKHFGQSNFLFKHVVCLNQSSPIESPDSDGVPVILECYETEEDLIVAWKNLIVKSDPDILYQYNGDQFDGQYLYKRAMMNHCEEFLLLGKLKNVKSSLIESRFSSSAYGSSNFKRLSMPGRINFDILIYIKREYKEDKYSLDHISEKYLGEHKNPITAQMMFKIFEENNPDKIADVVRYCLQDTLLPQKLVDKLHILQNQISMSNVSHVPIRFLIERGQQIKVYSQILKQTRKNNFLVPVLENAYDNPKTTEGNESDDEEEKFTGATVLPPIKGAYFEPITVCDFASLYPSIIRAHNLCYSTIVLDKKYLNLKGHTYKTLEWADTIDGREVSHSCVYSTKEEGILPKLLSELSFSRKEYKKLMKDATDPFLKEVYNKCQLAVKVSMNSAYGFFAAQLLCCKPLAASVTYLGRNMIKETKEFMEEKYSASCAVYGDTDSVFVKFKTQSSDKHVEAYNRHQEYPDNEEYHKKYLEYKKICIQESIDLGKIASKNATENLFIHPIELEYEKVYCPLLLLSKKKYIGVLYSENPSRPDKTDNKGVILQRRDNFKLLKTMYSKMLNIILEKGHNGVEESVEGIKEILYKIINNQYKDLDDFVISKLLKDTYKNQNIPHLVLARKMKARNPGSEPNSNDRVPYVFTYPDPNSTEGAKLIKYIEQERKKDYIDKVSKKSGQKITTLDEALKINKTLSTKTVLKKGNKYSQYEKVEDPSFMKQHSLPLDAEYYITFMKTSICEILSLFMESPEQIFDDIIEEFKESMW